MVEVAHIPLRLVYPAIGGRALNKPQVKVLAASMAAIGLRTPITVTPTERVANGSAIAAYDVVAGRHRYEAARSLNWETIDAFVVEGDVDDRRLWQIDENFTHGALSDAERAIEHVERRDIMVRKGLASAPGKGGNRQVGDRSYAAQTAEAVGQSRRAVERDIARGEKIAPVILAEVAGTAMDKGVVLDRLAATPISEQASVLSSLRADRSRVKLASPPLNDAEAVERQLAALMSAWNRAGSEARSRFLSKVEA